MEPVTGEAGSGAQKASGTEFLSKIDISDEAAVARAVAAARAAFGPIIILINAAGISGPGAAHELTVADKTLNVNLKGCFLTTKYIAPMMLDSGCGKIVHITSLVAFSSLDNLL
jgi:2-hydroxycyclohexanecarboxyl-CoA dehydrogenase